MATITITNISLSRLSLDIPVPSGGIGEGHPKAIRASLDTGESIDVGNIITVDDLNRTAEFQALMAANLISVVATAEVNDVAIPAVVSGTGWTDAATLITLTTLTDTVAIGAAAMSGLGEKLRVVHSTALVASLETTLAGAAGVRLTLRHTKAGIGAVDADAVEGHPAACTVARRVQDPIALGREPSDAEDLVAAVQRGPRLG